MLGTAHETNANKSKLVERLRQISRGAPAPIGFGRVAAASAPAMLLVAILPRNEVVLAKAAVKAGADAIALRVCGAATEYLKETGDLAAESQTIKDTIAAVGKKVIVGLVVGSNGSLRADDLPAVAQLGVDFIATYPHLTPAAFLELSDVGRVAILDHFGGQVTRGVNDLSIQAALLRIDRPSDSAAEMTVLDVATYRAAADGIHRPVVVFPSWNLAASDLEVLKNAGIEGVAIVGPEPEADAAKLEATIVPFREVVGRLGKPTGRRVALSEPAVILPRAASVGGEEPDEDDEDDDE